MVNREYNSLEEIIEGSKRREQQAEEQLYKSYFGYALTVALLYIKNYEDATIAVNDSFLKVFDNIKRFKTGTPFKPWLRRIVINSSLDWIRSEKRQLELMEYNEEWDEGYQPQQQFGKREELTLLLKELPTLLRAVFLLYEVEGYSHKEIAKALAISTSSSRVYLSRAKKELRSGYLKLEEQFNREDE